MFKEENHTRTPCKPGVIFLKYWVKLFLKTLQKVNLLAQNAQNAQSKVLIRSLSNLQDCTEPSRLSPPRLIPKPKHSSLFQNPTTCGRMISLSVQTLHFLQVTLFASLILPQTSFGVHYWEVTAKGRWWTFFKKELKVEIFCANFKANRPPFDCNTLRQIFTLWKTRRLWMSFDKLVKFSPFRFNLAATLCFIVFQFHCWYLIWSSSSSDSH